MRQSRALAPTVSVLVALLVAACAATSQVDATVTHSALAEEKSAVVLMRIGAASPTCKHVAVLLGTRAEAGYRRHSIMQVAHVASLAEPAVAETKLGAGEYHVVGYSCHDGKRPHAVMQKADHDTYAKSFASFAVKPGEVVNVGYLHFTASRVGSNAFGRPVQSSVSVTDWPLAELDRFKQKRPEIYARMVTRLMAVTPPAEEATSHDCARLAALKAEGKVQALPAACANAATGRVAPSAGPSVKARTPS